MVVQSHDKYSLCSLLSVFLAALKLGLISFGGPTAHLVYFQNEYVKKRKWLSEHDYNELVALAQFLPGPTSSQVGIAIGTLRAGVVGGVLSFLGFTLPSMLVLVGLASVITTVNSIPPSLLQGLKLVAVAMVAHVILTMSKSILIGKLDYALAGLAFLVTLVWSNVWSQPLVILCAMLLATLWLKSKPNSHSVSSLSQPLPVSFAISCLVVFIVLLVLLPFMLGASASPFWLMFEQFYRSGSLVFGGGHIVLPLLEREFVHSGQVTAELFFTGYSLTQAVPGPLFTFASYIGYVLDGWKGAIIATFAIFLPAFLLVFGTLPFWQRLRRFTVISRAFHGASCAVVGILLTAFITPMLSSSINGFTDILLTVVLFLLLYRYNVAPWLLVLIAPILGYILL